MAEIVREALAGTLAAVQFKPPSSDLKTRPLLVPNQMVCPTTSKSFTIPYSPASGAGILPEGHPVPACAEVVRGVDLEVTAVRVAHGKTVLSVEEMYHVRE